MLTLYPGALGDPLECDVEEFNIASTESYETISYVWGKPERCHKIICAGHRLGLTASLHDALRRFRQPDRSRRLWADQICINQDDKAGRSQQVQFMNHIYKNASHVLVRKLEEIFQHQEKRGEFSVDHTDHLEKRSKDPWILLTHVTHLPWFTRTWIGQDIGTKAPATLFWGDEEIDPELLHSVYERLTDYHHLANTSISKPT